MIDVNTNIKPVRTRSVRVTVPRGENWAQRYRLPKYSIGAIIDSLISLGMGLTNQSDQDAQNAMSDTNQAGIILTRCCWLTDLVHALINTDGY